MVEAERRQVDDQLTLIADLRTKLDKAIGQRDRAVEILTGSYVCDKKTHQLSGDHCEDCVVELCKQIGYEYDGCSNLFERLEAGDGE